MNCVQEAFNEFKKRKRLLADGHLLPELNAIVVSYAVTEYQLFEEALMRRHNTQTQATAAVLLAKLQDAKHIFTERYLHTLIQSNMNFVAHEEVQPEIKLRNALCISTLEKCHRLQCYYYRHCLCERPLLPADIRRKRLTMPF